MDSQANRLVISSLEGQRCIYKCKVVICEARILAAKADDWGVRFEFEAITDLGMKLKSGRTFSSTGAWEIIGMWPNRVHAAYASWMVVYGGGVAEEIVTFASECENKMRVLDYVNFYPRKIWLEE